MSKTFTSANRLAFHHRLPGQRADVAEAEHRRAVRHHRHEVAARRVAERLVGIVVDQPAGQRDPGRVGHGQVALRQARLRGDNLEFAGPASIVVLQHIHFADHSYLAGEDRGRNRGS
jgi:uncharacterized protein YecE (DUF72 family)